MMLRARILSQGDEILAGRTLDTNAHRLAGLLSERGVGVVGITAAPDDPEALAAMFRQAAVDCDLLVSSGGLGPTADDHSADAAAAALGVPVERNDEALAQVEARYRSFGRPMPDSNIRQAMLPKGCDVLENPVGTAPGFAVTLGGARAFFFPGVPSELDHMVGLHLLPWLDRRGLTPPLRAAFHVCGVGESNLQDRLGRLDLPEGLRLGYKTWIPFNTVLLYASGDADAAERLARGSVMVREALGIDCFGSDDDTFAGAIGGLLRERGWMLATAESCTGGGAGRLLTEAVGSSAWFAGGVIAYSNEVKQRVLGVSEEVLMEQGAVSEACAAAMAEGAARALGAQVAVSITGIAGPGGGSPDKPVGTVCFGLALPDEATRTRTIRFGDRGRGNVRRLAEASVLEWLRRRLVKRGMSA